MKEISPILVFECAASKGLLAVLAHLNVPVAIIADFRHASVDFNITPCTMLSVSVLDAMVEIRRNRIQAGKPERVLPDFVRIIIFSSGHHRKQRVFGKQNVEQYFVRPGLVTEWDVLRALVQWKKSLSNSAQADLVAAITGSLYKLLRRAFWGTSPPPLSVVRLWTTSKSSAAACLWVFAHGRNVLFEPSPKKERPRITCQIGHSYYADLGRCQVCAAFLKQVSQSIPPGWMFASCISVLDCCIAWQDRDYTWRVTAICPSGHRMHLLIQHGEFINHRWKCTTCALEEELRQKRRQQHEAEQRRRKAEAEEAARASWYAYERWSQGGGRSQPPTRKLPIKALDSITDQDRKTAIDWICHYKTSPRLCLAVNEERPLTFTIIRKRYHYLALLVHSDKCKHPSAQEAFKILTASYQELAACYGAK